MAKSLALPIYLVYCFITSLLFWMTFTTDSVYYVSIVQMTPLQLVLTGTTLEATVLLLEVPRPGSWPISTAAAFRSSPASS